MIFYLQDFKAETFLVFLAAFATAMMTGLAFHEFSHAWAANELGDDTAARQGRLTLNPIRHLDPLGSALLLLFGFGWAKPTPVNPWRLRMGPRRGNALVAFAGPASNFFFAFVASLPIRLGLVDLSIKGRSGTSVIDIMEVALRHGHGEDFLYIYLYFVATLNVLLGIFNLIPIPPLDGFKVAVGLLPREAARSLERLAPYGPGIFMTLLMIGFIQPQLSPFNWIINWVYDDVFRFLT